MAICLDFDWQTNEFMLYCRSTQLREKTMSSYEQTLHLFGRWLSDELKIYTVDVETKNVIRKYPEFRKRTPVRTRKSENPPHHGWHHDPAGFYQ